MPATPSWSKMKKTEFARSQLARSRASVGLPEAMRLRDESETSFDKPARFRRSRLWRGWLLIA